MNVIEALRKLTGGTPNYQISTDADGTVTVPANHGAAGFRIHRNRARPSDRMTDEADLQQHIIAGSRVPAGLEREPAH